MPARSAIHLLDPNMHRPTSSRDARSVPALFVQLLARSASHPLGGGKALQTGLRPLSIPALVVLGQNGGHLGSMAWHTFNIMNLGILKLEAVNA